MTIRIADNSDLYEIQSLSKQLKLNLPDSVWDTNKYIEDGIQNKQYYLAEYNFEIIGFIQLIENSDHIEIKCLAVKGNQHKKGVGTFLIDFAKSYAKDKNIKNLEVSSYEDYNVKDFYIKNGFKQTRPGTNYGHKYFNFVYKISES